MRRRRNNEEDEEANFVAKNMGDLNEKFILEKQHLKLNVRRLRDRRQTGKTDLRLSNSAELGGTPGSLYGNCDVLDLELVANRLDFSLGNVTPPQQHVGTCRFEVVPIFTYVPHC